MVVVRPTRLYVVLRAPPGILDRRTLAGFRRIGARGWWRRRGLRLPRGVPGPAASAHVIGHAPRVGRQPLRLHVELVRPIMPDVRVRTWSIVTRQDDPEEDVDGDGQAPRDNCRGDPQQAYERRIDL